MLERDLGEGLGTVNVVMLNPSTADEVRDDPTIRRCIGFARGWGFRRLLVTNLFALRATRPTALRQAVDPVGPENDAYLRKAARRADAVVCAWGVHGGLRGRGAEVLALLRVTCAERLEYLGLTAGGSPRHPLYLPAGTTRQPFDARGTYLKVAPQLPAA